jgi:glycyl-tRNA synthetase beta chain
MNSNEATLLVEIGVEEIPSRFLTQLASDFAAGLEQALQGGRWAVRDPQHWYTPRRLIFQAVVARHQSPEIETVRGPAVTSAYRDGQPTQALAGFLHRVGLSEADLTRTMVGDREYLTACLQKPVESAAKTIPGIVADCLTKLPQPRSMRWGEGDVRFIRPIRWIVALLDDTILSGSALGVRFGHTTYGNRTDHPEGLEVSTVSQYWEALAQGRVMADAADRESRIVSEAAKLAEENGGRAEIDEELLAEVTNLVEWPTPFVGSFDADFLAVPEPVLVTSMRVHQRYFPVRDSQGGLRHYFVAVRNGVGEDLDLVRRGNEKVLRARLSDARYFFDHDIQEPLASRVGALAQVTVHAKLGTYQDKIDRMRRLLERTREWWPLSHGGFDAVRRAILLYKCDLLTQVVGEFPELQGEMGAIYAHRDNEDARVVDAIGDQYRPASGVDRLPKSVEGQVLGLLDRVDTLTAFYRANIRATGSEDPFGLRRAALGAARLASETDVMASHTMSELVTAALAETGASGDAAGEVTALIASRLETQWAEQWPRDLVAAVLAREFPWRELSYRLAFFDAHRGQSEALSLAYKRVARIVKSAAPSVSDAAQGFWGIEGVLYQASVDAASHEAGDLEGWWGAVNIMVPLVNQFFDEVLVMDPDQSIRERRLALLRRVLQVLGRYVDWEAL